MDVEGNVIQQNMGSAASHSPNLNPGLPLTNFKISGSFRSVCLRFTTCKIRIIIVNRITWGLNDIIRVMGLELNLAYRQVFNKY